MRSERCELFFFLLVVWLSPSREKDSRGRLLVLEGEVEGENDVPARGNATEDSVGAARGDAGGVMSLQEVLV